MSVLVSKIDLGILGLGAFAVFLIIRGAGQKLDGLFENGIGNVNIDLPSIDFPDVSNIFNQGGQATQEAISGLQKQLDDFIKGGLGNTGAESIRVDDGSEFFQNVEPPQQIVQPEGSSVQIRDDGQGNQTTIFSGGSEVLGPQGEVIPPALTGGIQNFIDNITSQQQQVQQVPVEQPFVGGAIFDTPIENLSLSQIVDRFNVSASQAANIQAVAKDDFGDFDFGTNTGSGIGSVISEPDINTFVNRGNVSNSEFAGLTATEIAQRLTGGIISNF